MAAAGAHNTTLHQPLGLTAVLLLAPAVLVLIAFFFVPMSTIVVGSFTAANRGAISFSFANYVEIITDDFYWEVLLRTVRVSFYTTVVALVVSYPAALFLYLSQGTWRRIFLLIVISPLFISVVVRTYGWIVILSPNGALNSVIPGGLPFRLLFTEPGIVIGLVHVYVPFMLLALNASLAKIDTRLLSAAASLGASNFRAFRDIIVPLSVPGIMAGCTIVFTVAITAFSTPVLLGGSRSKTMAYVIYQQVMFMSNWRTGAALAIGLVVTTFLLVFLFNRGMKLLNRNASS